MKCHVLMKLNFLDCDIGDFRASWCWHDPFWYKGGVMHDTLWIHFPQRTLAQLIKTGLPLSHYRQSRYRRQRLLGTWFKMPPCRGCRDHVEALTYRIPYPSSYVLFRSSQIRHDTFRLVVSLWHVCIPAHTKWRVRRAKKDLPNQSCRWQRK